MRRIVIAAALIALNALPSYAQATRHKPRGACTRVCVHKCEEDPGNQTVEQCIVLWDRINAQFGKDAARFEGRNGGRYDPQTGTIGDAQGNGYKLH